MEVVEQNNYIEIKIAYLRYAKERLRIFGNNFVKNNKDKCEIIYQGKNYELKEFIDEIDPYLNIKNEININNIKQNDIFELILRINKDITDMSFMFNDCSALKSFPTLYESNINIYFESENSENLYIHEISKISSKNESQDSSGKNVISSYLNEINSSITFKITNMCNMFCQCKSLESLPSFLSNLDT